MNKLIALLLLLLPASALAQTNISAQSHKQATLATQTITSAAAGTAIDTTGYSILLVQYKGTYTTNATAAGFQGSVDGGTTYISIPFYVMGITNSCLYQSVTGDLVDNSTNVFAVPVGSYNRVRTNALNWASGTIDVVIVGSANPGAPCVQIANFPALNFATDSVTIGAALPAGTNNIGDVDVLTLPSVTIGTFPDNEPINVAQLNGVTIAMNNGVSSTGTQRVTIANDSTGQVALATGSNTIGALTANQSVNAAQINGVTPLMGAGNTGTGSPRVTEATDSQLSAGVGATGDAAATAGSTGSLSAKQRLMTSQLDAIQTAAQLADDDQTGSSVNYRTSVGTTEDETEIKATAGRLFSVNITNTNAAVRYFRCYNLTAANTTPGTSTVFLGLAIPGATTGAGFMTNFGPAGIAFGTALTCTLTTGAADTDVAEVAANEVKWVITFK